MKRTWETPGALVGVFSDILAVFKKYGLGPGESMIALKFIEFDFIQRFKDKGDLAMLDLFKNLSQEIEHVVATTRPKADD